MNIATTSPDWHSIQVDDDVFRELQRHAEPLVDDANSVLRKILELTNTDVAQPSPKDVADTDHSPRRSGKTRPLAGAGTRQRSRSRGPSKAKRDRAPKGSLLPESEYEFPLLSVLQEFGGSAPASKVVDQVGQRLESRLTPIDRELVDSGKTRWRNRIQFVRIAMIKSGYMKKDSPRGIWEITESGKIRISELSEADNANK